MAVRGREEHLLRWLELVSCFLFFIPMVILSLHHFSNLFYSVAMSIKVFGKKKKVVVSSTQGAR